MNGPPTTATRQNPFNLEVYFQRNMECNVCDKKAIGVLYLDDGEDVESYIKNRFHYVKFSSTDSETMHGGSLISIAQKGADFELNQNTLLEDIHIYGLPDMLITTVTINGKQTVFTQDATSLSIKSINLDITDNFELAWNRK